MLKITTEFEPESRPLQGIPNGTIFTGVIDGFVSSGPFIKIGSVTQRLWVVAKLEAMEGCVWTSEKDTAVRVAHYRALPVRQVVLRDHVEEPKSVTVTIP